MLHLSVFVSGNGSNFRAIHSAILRGELDAHIACVISSRPDTKAIEYASANGIPTFVEPKKSELQSDYVLRLIEYLTKHNVDFIALCGYLRLIPSELVSAFRHRLTNVHPALLPAFGGEGMYGRRVHEAVLASGAKVSGATIHLVDEEYDHGAIVAQECVPVYPDDTPESLAERVLEVEHRLYPRTLQSFSTGKVHVETTTGIATITP